MAGSTSQRALRKGGGYYKFTLAGDARHVFRRAARSRWYYAEGLGLFKSVMLRLGVSSEGVYQCTGIAFGIDEGDEGTDSISARALRIPLTDIVASLAGSVFAGQQWPRPRAEGRTVEAQGVEELIGFYQEGATHAPRVALGRRPKPDGFYENVADDYRKAQKVNPRAPMKALGEMRHEAPRTLKHLVAVARKKGYLKKWQPPKRKEGRKR